MRRVALLAVLLVLSYIFILPGLDAVIHQQYSGPNILQGKGFHLEATGRNAVLFGLKMLLLGLVIGGIAVYAVLWWERED